MFIKLIRELKTRFMSEKLLGDTNNGAYKKLEYDRSVRTIKSFLADSDSRQENLEYVTFMKKMVLADLQYDYLTEILYKEAHRTTNFSRLSLLPNVFTNSEGEEKTILTDTKKKMDVKSVGILVTGWKVKHFNQSMRDVMNSSFKTSKTDPEIVHYYMGMNLTIVYQKNHHIAAGTIIGKGKILVDVFDTTAMFPYIFTDGEWWYQKDIKTGSRKRLFEVYDFRIAVLYELARIESEL